MKEAKPNRHHKRVIALAAKEPLMLTHREKYEDKWTAGGVEVTANCALACIRNGWLRPNDDGLFEGSSQTWAPI